MRPRLTIAGLLSVVAFCGIAFASLSSPSQLWASTLFALTLGILTLAVLNLIYSRQRTRAFWVGFVVCGWAYLLAVFGPWFGEEVGPRLVTTALLDLLYSQIEPPRASAFPPDPSRWSLWAMPDRTSGPWPRIGWLYLVSPETFRRIGHSLLTLLIAAVGGLYARYRYVSLPDQGSPA